MTQTLTFGLRGIDPLDNYEPNATQLQLWSLFTESRTHPANLTVNAVRAMVEVQQSERILECYRRLLQDPECCYSVIEAVLNNLSPCRENSDSQFFQWAADAAIDSIREVPLSLAALSGAHYLARHIGQSSVCAALEKLLSVPEGEQSDTLSSTVVDCLLWGLNKYQQPLNDANRRLLEAVKTKGMGRWPNEHRKTLLDSDALRAV